MAITPLKKVSSNDKNHQPKQNPSQTFAQMFFSEVLDEACDREHEKHIQVRTNGYTKDALPYYNFIKMREYY